MNQITKIQFLLFYNFKRRPTGSRPLTGLQARPGYGCKRKTIQGCFFLVQRNLGLTNLKGPKILFFIAGVLLLQGIFIIKSSTKVALKVERYALGSEILEYSPQFGIIQQ
jgi:hypothetical protein